MARGVFEVPSKGVWRYTFMTNDWASSGKWEHYDDMLAWCEDQFGPRGKSHGSPEAWISLSRSHFCFRDENHAFAFKMRWL